MLVLLLNKDLVAHVMQLQQFRQSKPCIPFMFLMASILNFPFSKSLIAQIQYLMDVWEDGFNQAFNLLKILELLVIFNTHIVQDHLDPVKAVYMKLGHSKLIRILV